MMNWRAMMAKQREGSECHPQKEQKEQKGWIKGSFADCALFADSIRTLQNVVDLHGITLNQFREVAGDDWNMVENDHDLADSAAIAIATRLTRERGEIPASYTAVTHCESCGTVVPIFPGSPSRVLACVWCHNREAGLPVPSPIIEKPSEPVCTRCGKRNRVAKCADNGVLVNLCWPCRHADSEEMAAKDQDNSEGEIA